MLQQHARRRACGDGLFDCAAERISTRTCSTSSCRVETHARPRARARRLMIQQLLRARAPGSPDGGRFRPAASRHRAPQCRSAAATGVARGRRVGDVAARRARGFVATLLAARRGAAGRALGVEPPRSLSPTRRSRRAGAARCRAAPTAPPSFNLFGIKAGGQLAGRGGGSRTRSSTRRGARGRAHASTSGPTARSPRACATTSRLIGSNPRYAAALDAGANAGAYRGALQRGGYATDPDYARKLERSWPNPFSPCCAAEHSSSRRHCRYTRSGRAT